VAHLHLGLILPNYGEAVGADRLASAAAAAETAGFDSGWVTDHLIVPPEHAPVYGTIAEGLVSLGFLAARTQRLELGVSALVVSQRNPLVALKQLTTLDLLSGGRIVTAVAAGWMEGEFALLGADFERRGRLLDEWLDLAASVFEQMPGRIVYEGDLFSVDGSLSPALVRPGGPELWVAGVSRATLRRATRTGVWHPVGLAPKELRPLAAELRGRRPDSRVVLRIGLRQCGSNWRTRPMTVVEAPEVLNFRRSTYSGESYMRCAATASGNRMAMHGCGVSPSTLSTPSNVFSNTPSTRTRLRARRRSPSRVRRTRASGHGRQPPGGSRGRASS
jgi:hypothetical protein